MIYQYLLVLVVITTSSGGDNAKLSDIQSRIQTLELDTKQYLQNLKTFAESCFCNCTMKGNKGSPGFSGFVGLKGPRGNNGERGPRGDKGAPYSGTAKAKSLYDDIAYVDRQKRIYQGYQGFYGPWGQIGDKGDEMQCDCRNHLKKCISWCKGGEGPMGDKGEKGELGKRGDSGDKGEPGTYLHGL